MNTRSRTGIHFDPSTRLLLSPSAIPFVVTHIATTTTRTNSNNVRLYTMSFIDVALRIPPENIVCEVRDEHVLQVRLRGVRVVAHEDDYHHPQDIRHVGRLEAQGQEEPEPPRRSLVLREHEGHERGREDAEGDDRAARECDVSFDPLFDFSIVSTKGTRKCPYRGEEILYGEDSS